MAPKVRSHIQGLGGFGHYPARNIVRACGGGSYMTYLPKTKGGIITCGLFITDYNPWLERADILRGEIWCEEGDAVEKGKLLCSTKQLIPCFVKNFSESGFWGPYGYYAGEEFVLRETNPPAVARRQRVLDEMYPSRRDPWRILGAYFALKFKHL